MATNKLLTKITSIAELKNIFNEILFNTTDKISKITSTSINNGVSYGVAKIAQKAIKDVAVLESQIFPEFATGQYLDSAAKLWFSEERGSAVGSSTFVRIKAASGAVYKPGLNRFIATSGVEFELTSEVVIGSLGYGYGKVRSVPTGSGTNVDAFTINIVNPQPTGHISVTNEYKAIGGEDSEVDSIFRERLLNSKNISSTNTVSYITEVLKTFDSDVLKVFNLGFDDNYIINLSIVRVNGADYTDIELIDLKQRLLPHLCLSDTVSKDGSVKLVNANWHYVGGNSVGVDFRVDIPINFNTDEVRKNIQIAITKYLDFRFWDKPKVYWSDLLEVVKGVEGVSFVPSEHFYPNNDEVVLTNYLPRVKVFKMRDLSGTIIFDSANKISPVFYTNS